jgi:hypothetical protein
VIDTILIQFGGVVVQSLDRIIIQQINSIKGSHISRFVELEISSICESLKIGKITEEEFYKKVTHSASIEMDKPGFLELVISGSKSPEGIQDFLRLLKRYFSIWMTVDFPEEYFWAIIQRHQISELSSGVNFIHLPKERLDLTSSAVLQKQLKIQSDPLIIEPDCKLAMKYVRKGMQVSHFIDCHRSVRELALRKLIPLEDENRFSPWRNNETRSSNLS